MRNFFRALIALTVCTRSVAAEEPPATALPLDANGACVARIVAAASAWEKSCQGLDTTLIVEDLGTKAISIDDVPCSLWNGESKTYTKYRWRSDNRGRTMVQKFRVCASFVEACDAHEVITDLLWTGGVFYVINYKEDHRELIVDTRVVARPPEDCLLLFNGGVAWQTFMGQLSLSQSFREMALLAFVEDGGGIRTTWRFHPQSSSQVIAEFSEEDLKMRSIRREVFELDSDPTPQHLSVQLHFGVDEWKQHGDFTLPQVAHSVGATVRHEIMEAQGRKPFAHGYRFSRLDARPLVAAEMVTLFDPPSLNAGDIVLDKTLRVSYRIGDMHLMLDGRRRETVSPMNALLGDDLPPLLPEREGTPFTQSERKPG